MNKRIKKSLKLQLFFAALIAVSLAVVTFGISFFLGSVLLDRTVYGDSFALMMAEKRLEKLQTFVEDENITLSTADKIDTWCKSEKRVRLILLSDTTPIYEFPPSDNSNEGTASEHTIYDLDNTYQITLNDGTKLHAIIYYYTGNSFYQWRTVISGIIAFAVFSTCFIMFVNKKVSYITLLQQELEILSGGQLEYNVTVKGTDEIGELARGIDEMRKSIIKHQEIENQVRAANSELITSMSHDLRTPLTSLLVYLEILERKKYTDEDQMYSLIHKSVTQTMRIKDMADRLFRYFLAYATEFENSELEETDADQLFQQIFDDYGYSLESKGFNVETEFDVTEGHVKINADLLHRSLDNLYSNILKYADYGSPVKFVYTKCDGNVVFSIVNKINMNREKTDSTSIGLNTCKRIIQYHGGNFSTAEENGTFTVKIELPLTSSHTP